jgi:Ca2+-binding EF-hand superfamily protein
MSGLASSQINALKVAFDHCDKEKTGRISVTELLDALHCLSYDSSFKVLYSAIKELDSEKFRQEGVNFEQLLQAISNKLFTDDKRKQIEKQFDLLKNDEGVIDKERIKTILHEISRYLPDEEIDNIIKTASSDRKGITLNDFTQKLIK